MSQKERILFKNSVNKGFDNKSHIKQQDNANLRKQHEKAKNLIIKKFNVTDREAEEILRKIAKKAQNTNNHLPNSISHTPQEKEFENSKNINQKDLKSSKKSKQTHKFEITPKNPKITQTNQKTQKIKNPTTKSNEITTKKPQTTQKTNQKTQKIKNNTQTENQTKNDKTGKHWININLNNLKSSKETKPTTETNTKTPSKETKPTTETNTKTPEIKNDILDTNKPKKQNQDVDSILTSIIPDYNKHLSVEVSHISLTFDVETEKVDTLKESFIRTLRRSKSEKIKFKALNDISFKIYKGEKIGVIGYNGAGKSTLLKVVCGIYKPDGGFVKTNGRISPLLSLGSGFDYNYSGRQNIILDGAVLGYDKEYLESKIDEIIEFSELGDFIDVPIKNYSSGMIAKLGFSIATILDPDILVIDEVLAVGDVNFSKKSSDKIKSLMDGGTTVLFVSHSIPQVREICDKAIWIDKGKIREIGEVNKVCDNYLKDAEKASKNQIANIQFR